MSLSIYTYSNPYEINNEPYWDSIRNCAHFCVSQTMVNGLSAVYDELDNGQLATVEELVEALYPGWFDTKTYIEQYTILTNTLDKVTPNIEPDRWKKIKQSLRFNKSALLDSIRLMAEMGLLLKNIKIKNNIKIKLKKYWKIIYLSLLSMVLMLVVIIRKIQILML